MIFRHGQNDSDRIGRQTSSMLSFFWRRGASVKFALCFRKEPTLFLGRQRRRFPKIELCLGWDKFFLPLFPALPLSPSLPPPTHTHKQTRCAASNQRNKENQSAPAQKGRSSKSAAKNALKTRSGAIPWPCWGAVCLRDRSFDFSRPFFFFFSPSRFLSETATWAPLFFNAVNSLP